MPTRVYSPSGEPFDIPRRDLADKLILQYGWTQTAPSIEIVEEASVKKPVKRRKTKAPKPSVFSNFHEEVSDDS